MLCMEYFFSLQASENNKIRHLAPESTINFVLTQYLHLSDSQWTATRFGDMGFNGQGLLGMELSVYHIQADHQTFYS